MRTENVYQTSKEIQSSLTNYPDSHHSLRSKIQLYSRMDSVKDSMDLVKVQMSLVHSTKTDWDHSVKTDWDHSVKTD